MMTFRNYFISICAIVFVTGLLYVGYSSNLMSCSTQQTDSNKKEGKQGDSELRSSPGTHEKQEDFILHASPGTEEKREDLGLHASPRKEGKQGDSELRSSPGTHEKQEDFILHASPGMKEKHEDWGLHSLPGHKYRQPSSLDGRRDIASVTPWLAPIVWEGTFDPTLIDPIYKQKNITIAITVFAVGKYIQFFKEFLESAEQHLFLGFRVHYYLFTDQPEAVANLKLGEEREIIVRKVPSAKRWQDVSMGRMEAVQKLAESELVNKADYVFCFDVDAKFYARWSVETLSHLVAVIHPWFYNYPRNQFTYERRPESEAFIPADEGDYYYAGGAFGGTVQEVYKLTKTCTEKQNLDRTKTIEAVWHDESHLNKYFLLNKPSKLLSPEYLWRDINARTNEVKIVRFTSVAKNVAEVRPNV